MNKIKAKILIFRVRRGDKEAFREIYQSLVDRIYRFVFYRVANEEVAQDLLQDIFLKTWNYIKNEENKEVGNLQALVYKIARNLIIDYYRSDLNTNRQTVTIENLDYKIEDEKGSNIKEEIDVKISIQQVREKLNQLDNPVHKEIVELRYVDELSYKEIAEILDKTEKNVSVILHRSLKKIKELLAEENK